MLQYFQWNRVVLVSEPEQDDLSNLDIQEEFKVNHKNYRLLKLEILFLKNNISSISAEQMYAKLNDININSTTTIPDSYVASEASDPNQSESTKSHNVNFLLNVIDETKEQTRGYNI